MDGVLNNRRALELAEADPPIHPPGPLGMVFTVDPECVARLRALVEELDLKIVLSSTWRHHPHAFQTAMDWAGWPDIPFIGRTPRRAQEVLKHYVRGSEIAEWLGQHKVESFCIVDDSVHDIHQTERLVRTETEVGLTDTHIQQIRELMRDWHSHQDHVKVSP